MSKCLIMSSVVLMIFVSLLTNAYAWVIQEEIFTHKLDSHHQYEHVDDHNLDFVTHLCLDATRRYNSFYSTLTPLIPTLEGEEALVVSVPVTLPELIPDLPCHYPRKTLTSY